MSKKKAGRPDFLLFLSLLFVILIYPILERTGLGRALVGFAIFLPLTFATIEMVQLKGWARRSLFLIACIFVLSVVDALTLHPMVTSIKWALVAVFLVLSVSALFSYLWTTRVVTTGHLYTAMSIYFLLALLWFSLYSAIDAVYPSAFLHNAKPSDRPSDLLYFSFITLTTAGYGDILPTVGEVRMLAALEAATGVLYVAIMIALLVSAYRQPNDPSAHA